MFVVPVKLVEEAVAPTARAEIGPTLSWSWADIEDILSGEWEIGGLAMTTATGHARTCSE